MASWRRPRWHRWSRAEIDSRAYLHPRPPADPRIICCNAAMLWVAIVQTWRGAPPTSINARAFDVQLNTFYLAVLATAAVFLLSAAWVRSQYLSWSLELIGCVGAAVLLGMFAANQLEVSQNATATQSWSWSAALATGNAWRAYRIVRRLFGADGELD